MSKLRPCVVEIPEEREQWRTTKGKITLGKVVREAEEHKNALFHQWHEQFWTCGQSVMVGGYAAGQMSDIVGVVEYEDGTVHFVEPKYIRFTDKDTEGQAAE